MFAVLHMPAHLQLQAIHKFLDFSTSCLLTSIFQDQFTQKFFKSGQDLVFIRFTYSYTVSMQRETMKAQSEWNQERQ